MKLVLRLYEEGYKRYKVGFKGIKGRQQWATFINDIVYTAALNGTATTTFSAFIFFNFFFLDLHLQMIQIWENNLSHFFLPSHPCVCVCVCLHAGGVIIHTQGSVWQDDADAPGRPSPRPPQRAVGAAAWCLQRRLHRARIGFGEP